MKTYECIKLSWKGKHAWNEWKVESFSKEAEDAKIVQMKILEWEKYNSQNKNISGCAQ